MPALAQLMELRARAIDLGVELGCTSAPPASWPLSVGYYDRAIAGGVVFAVGGDTLEEHIELLADVVELVERARAR